VNSFGSSFNTIAMQGVMANTWMIQKLLRQSKYPLKDIGR